MPLLVFLHGAGGNGQGSAALITGAAEGAGVAVLLPSSRGATWDLLTGRLGPDVVTIDTALERTFATLSVENSRVAMGGFSDGASYALSIGLANGDLFEAVLAFAPGFLAPPTREGQPRVYVSHGADDRVLPVDRCGRRVVSTLRADGYDVRYDEFAGGHVVPPELAVAGLGEWLSPADQPERD